MKKKYPLIERAVKMLVADNGIGRPDLIVRWAPAFDTIETALSLLTKKEFETFCIGDQNEKAGIIRDARLSGLKAADKFLDQIFDG